jgi:hypothetical protein
MASETLADDMLVGVAAIATFLGWPERRTYDRAEKKMLPVFKDGRLWVGRKSTLRSFIEGLEAAARLRGAPQSGGARHD